MVKAPSLSRNTLPMVVGNKSIGTFDSRPVVSPLGVRAFNLGPAGGEGGAARRRGGTPAPVAAPQGPPRGRRRPEAGTATRRRPTRPAVRRATWRSAHRRRGRRRSYTPSPGKFRWGSATVAPRRPAAAGGRTDRRAGYPGD